MTHRQYPFLQETPFEFDRWLNVRSQYTLNSKIKEIKVVIKVDGLEVCYLHGIQNISFQFVAGIYSSLIRLVLLISTGNQRSHTKEFRARGNLAIRKKLLPSPHVPFHFLIGQSGS